MTNTTINFILALIGSYLIGSIPTAYVLVRLRLRQDIRNMGSGTMGARNVYRVLGWRSAVLVLLLDAAKGAAAIYLCYRLGVDPYLGLAAAVVGHIFPVWLKFQGGKGLATALGGLAGMGMWPALLVFGLIWAPNYFLIWSKNMNIAVIAGAIGGAVYALISRASLGLVLMAMVIILKHFMALRAKETTQPGESKTQ